MKVVLMVFLNLMFASIIGLYSWAAIRFWNTDRGASISGAMASLQFFTIWLIAGSAWLIGDDIRDHVWWMLAAVVLSTFLRYWAVHRYRRRSTTLTAPEAERPGTG